MGCFLQQTMIWICMFILFISVSLSVFILSVKLLGEKVDKRMCVIYCVIHCALLLIANIFFLNALNLFSTFSWYIILNTIVSLVLTFILKKKYKISFIKTISAVSLGYSITYTFSCVFEEFLLKYFDDYENLVLRTVLFVILPAIFTLIMSFAISFILHKTEFHRYFSYLFSSKLKSFCAFIVCFALMHAWSIIDIIYTDKNLTFGYGIAFLLVITIALFCLQFAAMYTAGNEKIRLQEETIIQQQTQMILFEELQQEIKTFRHDFVNLFSSVTLKAKDGDLDGIQDFVKKTSGYFDEKLGDEIQQLEGLANIKNYPLRSLLTIKLAAMRQKNINAELEVLYPIYSVNIRTEDLIRCVGVLLDNAIEGASKDYGIVRIVFLHHSSELYIAISNNYDVKPNLVDIKNKNYTTKGKGHGTGLVSLQRILSGYDRCASRTFIKDEFFTQELYVPANLSAKEFQ